MSLVEVADIGKNILVIVNSVNQSTKNRIDVLENSDTIIAINIRIVYILSQTCFFRDIQTNALAEVSKRKDIDMSKILFVHAL